MAKQFRFYKEDNRWYIDVPEYIEAGIGTKDNLEMVLGADDLLDALSKNGIQVTLEIADYCPATSNELDQPFDMLEKTINNPPGTGATYTWIDWDSKGAPEYVCWLCPVAEYVFGRYPEFIYFRIVNND